MFYICGYIIHKKYIILSFLGAIFSSLYKTIKYSIILNMKKLNLVKFKQ